MNHNYVTRQNGKIIVDLTGFTNSKDKIECLKKVKGSYSGDRVEVIGELIGNRENVFGLDCSGFTFKDQIQFTKSTFNTEINFSFCHFEDAVNFNDSEFRRNVRFHNTTFTKSVKFRNTSFKGLADFFMAKFHDVQQFYLTDFYDRAIFSNALFYRPVQFLYNRVETSSFISFEKAKFKESLDISRANFNCKVNFWAVEITRYPKDYNLYVFDGETSKHKITKDDMAFTLRKIRESFRRVKQEFVNEGNRIDAMHYQVEEMRVYKKELSFYRFYRRLGDKLLLALNFLSNNYGVNWGRGLLFTMVTAFFVFALLMKYLYGGVALNSDSWILYVSIYFKVLNVAYWDFKDLEITSNRGEVMYIILFLGRIFIAYGYYQTISAFRKFGKKT